VQAHAKGVRLDKKRFAKRVAIALGFISLGAVPGLTRTQSSPPSPAQARRVTASNGRPKKVTPPEDEFAGLTFTDEQKAKMDQIHQNMQPSMDAVVKDEKSTAEQKAAMLEGLQRMERRQVFKVLTPEQQIEVRKKILARRAAEQAESKKKHQRPPK